MLSARGSAFCARGFARIPTTLSVVELELQDAVVIVGFWRAMPSCL